MMDPQVKVSGLLILRKWNAHCKVDQKYDPVRTSVKDTLTESGMKSSSTFKSTSDHRTLDWVESTREWRASHDDLHIALIP